jgi:hypothetical protein
MVGPFGGEANALMPFFVIARSASDEAIQTEHRKGPTEASGRAFGGVQ